MCDIRNALNKPSNQPSKPFNEVKSCGPSRKHSLDLQENDGSSGVFDFSSMDDGEENSQHGRLSIASMGSPRMQKGEEILSPTGKKKIRRNPQSK